MPADLRQAFAASNPFRRDRQGIQVGDDDQLVAGGPDPDLRPDQPGRGGVANRAEPDRLVGVDHPGGPQRDRVRRDGQHVQPSPLLN